MKILLNVNATTGVQTWLHPDPDRPGTSHVRTVYDRLPALKEAARLRSERQTGDVRKIGEIPTPLFFQLIREGKIGEYDPIRGGFHVDIRKLRATLNSPEYAGLKCIDGRA